MQANSHMIFVYLNASAPLGNVALLYVVNAKAKGQWHFINLNSKFNPRNHSGTLTAMAKVIFQMVVYLYQHYDYKHCSVNLFCTRKMLQQWHTAIVQHKPVHVSDSYQSAWHYFKRAVKGLNYFFAVSWTTYHRANFNKLLESNHWLAKHIADQRRTPKQLFRAICNRRNYDSQKVLNQILTVFNQMCIKKEI